MEVTKKCRNCSECKPLYTKGEFAFWDHNDYYCARQDKMTSPNDVCSCWQKRERTCDVSVQRIDEVIADLNFVKENIEN